MPLYSDAEIERLDRAASLLFEAEDQLPVLRILGWDRSIADRFFASGERELPRPHYAIPDMAPLREKLRAARDLVEGDSPVHAWLHRTADVIDRATALLQSVGTRNFHAHSRALYGGPDEAIADGQATALDLAMRLNDVLSEFDGEDLNPGAGGRMTPAELKGKLDDRLPHYFGNDAPRIEITTDVNARAAAGKDYIKLRADADFSDTDFIQLLQHEALVHIATGANGRANERFRILGESHPGNARTQEGLAVFAEFISGALDPRRFKRLSDRTIAIDLAESGADFLEIYRFFRERNPSEPPFEAFESARRVVRGGLVEGGAPFTKDSIYLGGLLDVHSYLRAAVKTGNPLFTRLLFVGKIDLQDLEAMKVLLDEGHIAPPAIMPPWAVDQRFLVSYLAYSSFLNTIDLGEVDRRHRGILGMQAQDTAA